MSLSDFDRWYELHRGLHPWAKLPEPDTPRGGILTDAWFDQLRSHDITYDEAERASKVMVGRPPRGERTHFPMILQICLRLRKKPEAPPASSVPQYDPLTAEDLEHIYTMATTDSPLIPPQIRKLAAAVLRGQVARGLAPDYVLEFLEEAATQTR